MANSEGVKKRVDIIAKELSLGHNRDKLLSEYVQKWQISSRTFDRILKKAQGQAKGLRQAIQKEVTRQSIEVAGKEFTGHILTKLEKQDKLRQIVQGELMCEKVVVIQGAAKKIMAKPDQSDVMKAIDLDNKMAGDYAPTKSIELGGSINIDKWINANADSDS